MAPAGLCHSGAKGWQIVHECCECGARPRNWVAVDTIEPDDVTAVAALQPDVTRC